MAAPFYRLAGCPASRRQSGLAFGLVRNAVIACLNHDGRGQRSDGVTTSYKGCEGRGHKAGSVNGEAAPCPDVGPHRQRPTRDFIRVDLASRCNSQDAEFAFGQDGWRSNVDGEPLPFNPAAAVPRP